MLAFATSVCVSEQMFLIKLIVSSVRLMNASSVGEKKKKEPAVQATMGKLSPMQKQDLMTFFGIIRPFLFFLQSNYIIRYFHNL